MSEMKKAISELRFLLAAIRGRQEELDGLSRQFKRQLDRAPNYAIQGGNSLGGGAEHYGGDTGAPGQRGDDAKAPLSIRERAQSELQALELTNKIEHAKTELASLGGRGSPGERTPNAQAKKIEELERLVQEASIRAAQNIAGNLPGPGRRTEA